MTTSKEKRRPGGEITKRPSKINVIADTSGSMDENGKIQELNNCMREAVPYLKKLDEDTPGAEIQISVMTFDESPKWVVQNEPIKDFVWKDLKANPNGETNIGQAFSMLAMEMSSNMPERGYPPLIVVITDGMATDSYKKGLDEFLDTKWGQKSVRQAIAIGKDADISVLNKFINNSEIKPIKANNPEQLAKAIRFVSTVALKKVSTPGVGIDAHPESIMDNTPDFYPPTTEDDVW